MYAACLLLIIFAPIICICVSEDAYFNARQDLLETSSKSQLGFDLVLTPDEQRVNQFLITLKKKELLEDRSAGRSLQEDIFMDIKEKIDKRPVFQLIRKMPKGAINHIHDMSIGNYMPHLKKWTYLPECYMCHNEKEKILLFKISKKIPESVPDCMWISVPEVRANSTNHEEFDKFLLSFLTLDSAEISQLNTQNKVWKRFQNIFTTFWGLFSYEEFLKEYLEESLEELLADNIQFIELKSVLPPLYAMDGCLPENPLYTLKTQINVLEKFRQRNKLDYFGTKYIYAVLRSTNEDVITKAVVDSLAMQKEFPEYFAGFDLVGQEDLGLPLKDFIKPLLMPSALNQTLPFVFHAGETDFQGHDVDENLFDAVLLNSTRLGHGFALMKHPKLKEEARRKKIAVELCPISNQVLGLVADIRDHPGSMLIAEDFPVTINPDDPPIWNASGVSYDYYQAFMGMTSQSAGLATLKKLILNSIEYSSLNAKEKSLLMEMWSAKWNKFVDDVIRENNL